MAFLEKEMEIVAIRPSIMHDIDTMLEYIEMWNKNDEDLLIASAAARVETYLRDVRAAEAKEESKVSADFSK